MGGSTGRRPVTLAGYKATSLDMTRLEAFAVRVARETTRTPEPLTQSVTQGEDRIEVVPGGWFRREKRITHRDIVHVAKPMSDPCWELARRRKKVTQRSFGVDRVEETFLVYVLMRDGTLRMVSWCTNEDQHPGRFLKSLDWGPNVRPISVQEVEQFDFERREQTTHRGSGQDRETIVSDWVPGPRPIYPNKGMGLSLALKRLL